MSTAAAEILETMFFVSPETAEPPCAWNTPKVSAEVQFHGDRSGRFDVQVDQALAADLAAGFLGEFGSGAVSLEQAEQMTCELANMLCGVTLSRLAPSGTFELGAPVPYSNDGNGTPVPSVSAAVCWLYSEDKLLRLELAWESSPGSRA